METTETLFVIGAGSGVDISMPKGSDLAKDIAESLRFEVDHFRTLKGGRDSIRFSLQMSDRRSDLPLQSTFDASVRIRNGIHLLNSIDDFVNLNSDNESIKFVSKLAIADSIMRAERSSKFYVADDNIYNRLSLSSVKDVWYIRLFELMSRSNPEDLFDNVSFINFNYDRCLEQFFTEAICALYGLSKEASLNIVGSARIYHPYGSLGSINPSDSNYLPFGGYTNRSSFDLSSITNSILTYSEQVSDESLTNAIGKTVREARRIVFLGYGYHSQNMKILLSQTSRGNVGKYIIGTAYDVSQPNLDVIMNYLSNLAAQREAGNTHYSPIIKTHPCTCRQLLVDYERVLKGR